MTIRTMCEARDKAVPRVRVLICENAGATRHGGEKPIARSECRYYCPDAATVERCVEAIRESGERLRAGPEAMMLWDSECTYFEADPGNEHGGGSILLGVAWYDAEFYAERREAGIGYMHKRIYAQIGVPLTNLEIVHWRLDQTA